ncbi:hypothetical protein ALC152_13390 [Arcobacter sp. 15-2]|uniref:toll/interleukin-1 receptor domain-containing protein n=1 Tax=Arcobacter sp. 15-2 TaxID=3374109 RepID=UPI00399D1B88
MKAIDRVRLINQIAVTLQEQMTYSDIDSYLPAFGIDCINYNPSTNSKRVYVQELLSHEKEEIILQIADELEIEYNQNKKQNLELATFWEQGHFKLFISHLAKHKKKATYLQKELKLYGIAGFVAHVDIEPSKQWQDEIEKALHTMDALTAILMHGFKESAWCDQEVGFAVGKDVLIIPIKKELDPYGFIGKYQAIQGNNTTVQEVAKSIFNTIVKHPKTRNNMITILINLISNSTHIETALKQLEILSNVSNLPQEILEQMASQIGNNSVLVKSSDFMKKLDVFFDKYEITMTYHDKDNNIEFVGKIPF